MIRGTGHVSDECRWYRDASRLIGASSSAPRFSDGVRAHAPDPVDQEGEESCVGEAISSAICVVESILGLPSVRPSARAIWYYARALEKRERFNVGCRPFDAYEGIALVGYVPDHAWPRWMPRDHEPNAEALRTAVDQSDLETGRITSFGEERCEDIRAALSSGAVGMTLAIQVDDAYSNNETGNWLLGGERRGGHYVTPTHYDESGLWHLGSYGPTWGLNGYCRIPWYVVADSDFTSDIWVVKKVSRFTE